ncbi:hypothetical protein RJ639_018623 [Escallonia herrerae]|uniref:Reverse transcriptase/retrotransposon-derived protein RNase H-like domain-containing protein n=1 Tax=Escallonia herrerae TaxID=1293975 RepID=A0AA88V7L7_9ASTE|nr:hypothetical protein RJ639_018623 [Escallonia herrerae]
MASCQAKNHKALIIEDLRDETRTQRVSHPLLTKPLTGEDLFIYLSVIEVTSSTVLVREENDKKKPIYYMSKGLQHVEARYPRIDKMVLALITSIMIPTSKESGSPGRSADSSLGMFNLNKAKGSLILQSEVRSKLL